MNPAARWWRRNFGDRRPVRTEVRPTPEFSVRGVAPRTADVYLPPGYDAARDAPYPVLLALDGQTMAQWRLAETIDALTSAGAIEAPVVVAVPASADRMDEYGTAGVLDFAGRGRRAKALQDLLSGEILPWVREHYHVADRPARTGIFGASLGGLCAFDTAWRRPQIFGFAGIFSGSLWWRGDDAGVAAQQASRIAHRRVRESARRPALRLWFEAGTRDETADRDGNGVIDAIQDTCELIGELEAAGFRRGPDLAYLEIPGGEHNESTWARALPDFLQWALPPGQDY